MRRCRASSGPWACSSCRTTTRTHDTQIAPQLTERNLERFRTLGADKGYDDRTQRRWLRAHGKRPLIRHREFAPYDKAANARMDQKLYRLSQ